ncbi:MAG: Uncharacterised protein [Formosa sp. Hel1_33_131]|nr:MAG: Uncharacterised protein [Formosa sp. Hel1_33_131]
MKYAFQKSSLEKKIKVDISHLFKKSALVILQYKLKQV